MLQYFFGGKYNKVAQNSKIAQACRLCFSFVAIQCFSSRIMYNSGQKMVKSQWVCRVGDFFEEDVWLQGAVYSEM